ncbi:MAG: PilZ domain-containing protein [Treponema sp.]|nr:PilZ domain-containing protein [Treponema sp.]
MKLLLVLGSDSNYGTILENVTPLGFQLIRYRHVLKAMDNIDEIDPAAVIISARDFPLHWKILVQFIRSERPKERCPIMLLKGDYFNEEETAKALFLGVNDIIEDIDQLRTILGSQTNADDKPRIFFVEPWHNIGLLVADLWGQSIIIGDVKTISTEGLTFEPMSSHPMDESILHRKLHECSLRAGDSILSPVCRITGTGKTIPADFISFPHNEQDLLNQYLQTI